MGVWEFTVHFLFYAVVIYSLSNAANWNNKDKKDN